MADVSENAVGNDGGTYGIEQARADVVTAIETQGLQASSTNGEKHEDLVKAGSAGFSFELRFNGRTLSLDGQDTNTIPAAEFQNFLERHRLAAEAGDLDAQITEALGQEGPMKALARVRAVDTDG